MIRTRFAPSPTGYLHVGGARTALFSWAYAKKMNGKFILRIEDTDLERSTPESVQAILDGMEWLNLEYDEGPFYQTQRFSRYKEVIDNLLAIGAAYYCYCTKEELEKQRQAAEAKREAFRYDGRWRPEPGKELPPIPDGVKPVVRFKMPTYGTTTWNDQIKGIICFENSQLDDLIIARADGSPTYNLCVVVDDYDMKITHIIRGDDHINNTPKQINILQSLTDKLPTYAHVPMIFNESGGKMSKRRDAVNVIDYQQMGILPEALLNYLARLGWSHGDEEIFTREEFLQWFKLQDINPSPSRFNMEKLLWLNGEYIKAMPITELTQAILKRLSSKGIDTTTSQLQPIVTLIRERHSNLNDMAQEAYYFYSPQTPSEEEKNKFWESDSSSRLRLFRELLKTIPENDWTSEMLDQFMKAFCQEQNIKMKQLAMPLRLQLFGTSKTPSIGIVLSLLGKDEVLSRLQALPS